MNTRLERDFAPGVDFVGKLGIAVVRDCAAARSPWGGDRDAAHQVGVFFGLDLARWQRISSSSLRGSLPSQTLASLTPSTNRNSNSMPCQRSNRPVSASSLARRRTYSWRNFFVRPVDLSISERSPTTKAQRQESPCSPSPSGGGVVRMPRYEWSQSSQ
jgi:hypothetical protein